MKILPMIRSKGQPASRMMGMNQGRRKLHYERDGCVTTGKDLSFNTLAKVHLLFVHKTGYVVAWLLMSSD